MCAIFSTPPPQKTQFNFLGFFLCRHTKQYNNRKSMEINVLQICGEKVRQERLNDIDFRTIRSSFNSIYVGLLNDKALHWKFYVFIDVYGVL